MTIPLSTLQPLHCQKDYSTQMLRDYQQSMKERLTAAWRSHRSVMVQMPTGVGKTHLLAEIVRETEGEVVVVAHRVELIAQITETLRAFGVEPSLEGAGGVKGVVGSPKKRVTVASIQTLSKRPEEAERLCPQLVVVDEAHHALAKTYRMMWDWWPEARFVGLTATPCRLNGKGFTELFDRLETAWSIREFIERGWLTDFEYVSVRPESEAMRRVASLSRRGADGDYQPREMATVMDCPESVEHLYDSYRHLAWGKRGIVYAIDRTHAAHIVERYRQGGVNCCLIDSRTPAKERERLVGEYRNGGVDVMVNVDIFSEGFDCPEVEFIQLARPTLSLAKYLQQVGRGMRVSPGKSHVMILDQVGLYQTFGLPTEERDWMPLFMGQQAGKGVAGNCREIVISHDRDEQMLVNLEMVRIKAPGSCRKGVEVFVKNGRYGVMRDGQVTCQAVFERVERLAGDYLLMGTYPYEVFRNRRTVIDREGEDLKAALYGEVVQQGDFFRGKDLTGRVIYWDAKGKGCYASLPEVVRAGRFEMVKLGERYRMREQVGGLDFDCKKEEIYIGEQVTIVGDRLIVKRDVKHAYKVYGYLNEGIVVENRQDSFKRAYWLLGADGKPIVDYGQLPWNLKGKPDLGRMKFKRME